VVAKERSRTLLFNPVFSDDPFFEMIKRTIFGDQSSADGNGMCAKSAYSFPAKTGRSRYFDFRNPIVGLAPAGLDFAVILRNCTELQ
jgi:hypothetical protein